MKPLLVTIAPELLTASKGKLALGIITSHVKVLPSTSTFDTAFNTSVAAVTASISQATSGIQSLPQVTALNESYRALGKSKSFKGSNEALLTRIKEGKGLYRINPVVDINNMISIESARSIGSYDLGKLGNEFVFRAGLPDETYTGTTKRAVDLNNLPVLVDINGPFGSPTSDSSRALITDSTTELMSVIYSFDGKDHLVRQLNDLKQLLEKHAEATDTQIYIVDGNNPINLNPALAQVQSPSATYSTTVKPAQDKKKAQPEKPNSLTMLDALIEEMLHYSPSVQFNPNVAVKSPDTKTVEPQKTELSSAEASAQPNTQKNQENDQQLHLVLKIRNDAAGRRYKPW